MDEIEFLHICELIFKNTNDPIILEKLKLVHILWKKSIDKILERSDVWKRACLNEIPSEPIPSMITRLFPTLYFHNYHQLDDLKVWRTVYISHRKWMILSKLRVSVKKSFYPALRADFSTTVILSSTSCGNYFAIGTSKGKIYLFDSNQLNEPMHTIDFEKPIKNMRFWIPASGDIFLVAILIANENTIKFWSVSAMREIECINLTDTRSDGFSTGSTNTLFTMRNGRFIEFKHTTDSIRSYYIDNLPLPAVTLKCFLENKKIVNVAKDRGSVTLINYRNQTSDGNYDIIEEDRQAIFASPDNVISTYQFKRPRFVFLTSNVILQQSDVEGENAHLLIYNQRTKWTKCEPFESFGRRNIITAGILHGKLLILGFETGEVRIYTVENIEELKTSKLDLNSGIEYRVSDSVYYGGVDELEVAETQGKLIIIVTSSQFHRNLTVAFVLMMELSKNFATGFSSTS